MERNFANPVQESEMEFEAWEEDEFYIELRRQILTIVEDEDEDDFIDAKYRVFYGLKRNYRGYPATVCCEDFLPLKNLKAGTAPAMQVRLGRSISGTGVFIPTVVGSRRRVCAGRKSRGRRQCKQSAGRVLEVIHPPVGKNLQKLS